MTHSESLPYVGHVAFHSKGASEVRLHDKQQHMLQNVSLEPCMHVKLIQTATVSCAHTHPSTPTCKVTKARYVEACSK